MSAEDANPIDVHVGLRLRRLREAARVSQAHLADRLQVTPGQVELYESGAGRLRASKLLQVARILNQPVSAFYEGLTESVAEPSGERGGGPASVVDLHARIEALSPKRRRLIETLVRALEVAT